MFNFTGEFIDYTDNIISFTVSFINMFIKLLVGYPASLGRKEGREGGEGGRGGREGEREAR